jgi:uncharacterized membrane protein (UPF0182 family)
LLVAAAVHYLYGGLRPQQKGARATPAARAHLFVLVGIFVLLKATAYWIDRYGIDFSQRGVVMTGASYTDVHALLPAKTVLAVIAVICAALFFAGALRRSSLLPAIGFGLLVLSAVIIGWVYPAIIQQFVVKPNELLKEQPYIHREIVSTRDAYGVARTTVRPYTATPTVSPGAAAQQAAKLPDVRLLDPGVISQTFQQLQQVKSYYHFDTVLAMDRYPVPGSTTVPEDMVVGVRDMTGPPAGQLNWVNQHLVYTHGFGFVAAAAGNTEPNGSPDFTESDINPPVGDLGSFQPRVYFGQNETNYVIVGGRQKELDYPNQSAAGQQNTIYQGTGGVPIGSLGDRLLFALKFRQLNILLSSAIDSHSKIMYIRDPVQRVAKVAPFLTLDGDPYPVIVEGQLDWVVDGYTSTDNYPYSERLGLAATTSDTYFPGGSAVGPGDQVNYVRNSVKAVVNAYTGKVSLFQWDTKDPILATWMNAFPGIIQPKKDIPASLLPHLRYPEVLFEMQRQVLSQFHVLQAQEFFGGQNFWSVPADPTPGPRNTTLQPPYYLTMTMPGQSSPEFSLVTSFTQRNRPNMAAYMAVDSNPLSTDYGHIRLLVLPQDSNTFGPGQVQNAFESDPTASIQLTQLRKGGSKVQLGNLITLPLGGGLLYTEPVYVSSVAAGNVGSYPLLKRVFAFYNTQAGYGATLQQALAQAFGQPSASTPPSGPSAPGKPNKAALRYIERAQRLYAQAQAALRRGDFTAYGRLLARMQAALASAQKAAQGPATAPKPRPSPSSSRSP